MLKLVKDDESRPDPAEFRIPASDTKGHSARQWFRCIPAMARQIEQVIQARQFPYRTKGGHIAPCSPPTHEMAKRIRPIPNGFGAGGCNVGAYEG